jgi:hypothetical protein
LRTVVVFDSKKKKEKMAKAPAQISAPTNVLRCIHVEWDEATGTFKGLRKYF